MELLLLILLVAVFLPDLVFGAVLVGLWLIERSVIGTCRLAIILMALLPLQPLVNWLAGAPKQL